MATKISVREAISSKMSEVGSAIHRTKRLRQSTLMDTELKRCLKTWGLIVFGLGSMIGSGVYVLTGEIVVDTAGPSAIISYFISGVISMLIAFCYAELGSLIPKAGSSYVYTYVAAGEFWGFICGWSMLAEHVIGCASIARGWSNYFDSFFDDAIKNWTVQYVGTIGSGTDDYPDLVAFALVLIITVLVCSGISISLNVTTIFLVVNIGILAFTSMFGFIWGDLSNWGGGVDAFFPYGAGGVLSASALLFYSYTGFDFISMCGEETKDPHKSIPIATISVMVICYFLYSTVTAALLTLCPYELLNADYAFTSAFTYVGRYGAATMVTSGILVAMFTTALVTLMGCPRLAYSMASDGMLPSCFASVNTWSQVPVVSTVTMGFAAGISCLLVSYSELVKLLSVGTLVSYFLVAMSLLLMRYTHKSETMFTNGVTLTPAAPDDAVAYGTFGVDEGSGDGADPNAKQKDSWCNGAMRSFMRKRSAAQYNTAVQFMTYILGISLVLFSLVLTLAITALGDGDVWAWFLFIVLLCGVLISSTFFAMLEETPYSTKPGFLVPFVPYTTILAMFSCIFLSFQLSGTSWIRFIIVLIIGLFVFFGYSIWHSKERESNTELKPDKTNSQEMLITGDE